MPVCTVGVVLCFLTSYVVCYDCSDVEKNKNRIKARESNRYSPPPVNRTSCYTTFIRATVTYTPVTHTPVINTCVTHTPLTPSLITPLFTPSLITRPVTTTYIRSHF